MKFKVLRQHLGDKMYMPGDVREADQHEVAHLVDRGVLAPEGTKADAPKANKAEKAAPKNKAE
ncbi:hypothetical protein [Sinorhizobium meliloti]|uniref:hypothetical protein n=1 Tax=Rhizobium meliloti TaxID=382 RepID=UPI000FE01565|nr:hypothetical protein [Sinorhizobium meliloti]RVL53949.1 hypothetical protein CN141_25530 [Sinorhizobium meliloti]